MHRLIRSAEHLYLDAVEEEEEDESHHIEGLGYTMDCDHHVGLELGDNAAHSLCICGKMKTDE